MAKRTAAVFAALAIATALGPLARAQTSSVEEDLLELINRARTRPLVMHEGLRAAARAHAADMAAAGRISHEGARSRIYASEPVPAEGDGPPDSGFTGTWCEVAGWEPVKADESVAKTFFDAWQAKSEDSACMMSRAMTVAGVGLYQSGSRWWATLNLVQDMTPPRRTGPAAVARAAPPRSVPSAPPAARATPTRNSGSSSVGDLARSRGGPSLTPDFGWREIAVAAGSMMVVPILHTVRRRRAGRRLRRTIGLR